MSEGTDGDQVVTDENQVIEGHQSQARRQAPRRNGFQACPHVTEMKIPQLMLQEHQSRRQHCENQCRPDRRAKPVKTRLFLIRQDRSSRVLEFQHILQSIGRDGYGPEPSGLFNGSAVEHDLRCIQI